MTKEEWNEIWELSCEIANTSLNEDAYTIDNLTSELLYKLSRLRMKYGEQPIFLSTKADYIEEIDERLTLYKRAVELSLEINDYSCLTQSAESITEIYIDEFSDFKNGEIWLNKLKKYISQYGDEWVVSEPKEIEIKLNRLKIRKV